MGVLNLPGSMKSEDTVIPLVATGGQHETRDSSKTLCKWCGQREGGRKEP